MKWLNPFIKLINIEIAFETDFTIKSKFSFDFKLNVNADANAAWPWATVTLH